MYNPYLKDWQNTDEYTWTLVKNGQPIATLRQCYQFSARVSVDIAIPDTKFKIKKTFEVGGLTLDSMLEKATNEIYTIIKNTANHLNSLLPGQKGDENA